MTDIPTTNIPNAIRYDFLLFLIGFILFAFPIYLEVVMKIQYDSSILLLIIGAFLMVLGVGYIKDDYDMEIESKEMMFIKEKYEFIQYLDKKDSNLMTQKTNENMLKDIKNRINKK